MKKELPTSPHLQIYKPQITSVLSITHRVTGFCMNLVLLLASIWLVALALGEFYYNLFVSFFLTMPFKLILIISLVGFNYHMLNGLRHMLWDLGFFLELRSSSILGYIVVILSLTISALFAFNLGIIK